MPPKRVLIVDDSPSIRRNVVGVLQEAGYDVVEADNGVAASQRIEEDHALALVVCDVHMPCMNGIDLLRSLKDAPRRPPFLMLTSEVEPGFMRDAKQAGARGWLVKPFKAAQLVATVGKILGHEPA